MLTLRQIYLLAFSLAMSPSCKGYMANVSIPNVKTTMDFPEGTVFQKLVEIGLAGQERHHAAATHIPWKTPGNGILTATQEHPNVGLLGLTGITGAGTHLPTSSPTVALPSSAHFSWQRISRCTPLTQKEKVGLKNFLWEKLTHLCTLVLWRYQAPPSKCNSNVGFLQMPFPLWNL